METLSNKNEHERQFVSFYIGNHFFGIDILMVQEVNDDFTITPIFQAPGQVSGYLNLRGEIALILNLAEPLGITKTNESKSKIIIFKEEIAEHFGIVVDRFNDVITVPESNYQPFIENNYNNELNILQEKQIINGICKLDSELMVTLDARKILSILENPNNE